MVARAPRPQAAALLWLILCEMPLGLSQRPSSGGSRVSDHPVLRATTCPGRLWAADEIPRLKQINLVMDAAEFRWLVEHQDLQYDLARTMQTTIELDGVSFPSGQVKVHGGMWQRAQGHGFGTDPSHINYNAGDCYRGHDRTAAFRCKPSWSIKFGKHNSSYVEMGGEDGIFRFPAAMQGCYTKAGGGVTPKKLVLRGEWNDPVFIRNKITQDVVKAMGGLAPRLEFARLSVNGEFFGLYSIEEHVDSHWAQCAGLNPHATATTSGPGASSSSSSSSSIPSLEETTLYKADRSGSQGCRWAAHCTGHCADGFERKMPDCDGCDNDFPFSPTAARGQTAECSCSPPTELGPFFEAISARGRSKAEVAALVNMTDFWIWQAATTLSGNPDTGNHNYYLYREPGQLYRPINVDSDWG